MSDQVKMSYNAALMRVRCEFTRAACEASEAPPADLMQRAKAKLESVKTAGEIAFYNIYETRLMDTWKALRTAEGEPPDRKVSLTLGAGAPPLPGLKVERAAVDKAIAMISVEASKEALANWRWEWFKLTVIRRMREAGVKEAPNNAQLYSVFARARNGEKLAGVAIGPAAAANSAGQAGKTFSVIANKQRMEIGVVIRSVKDLRTKTSRDTMLTMINQAVKQMSDQNTEYKILKKDFLAALQSAIDGPEGLDVELPVILLAAIGQPRSVQTANYPGAGRISFAVSADKMEATIVGFNKKYYDEGVFAVSPEWVQLELKRCGFNMPMADDIANALDEAIKKSEDLTNMLACRGQPGAGGRGPKLHPSYRDAETRAGGDLDVGDIDIRALQQRSTVKTGQLVAEIRYAEPPVQGRNVYGEDVPSPPNDDLIIQVGEGIQQRETGKFYATCDGLPILENGAISLSKVMIHGGDVNLRTGNINFDGPVEIKGSIDSGAIVYTTGDLIVHGSIRGGQVMAKGTITCMSGITTGEQGKVQARGDITAEFIENSNIICGGNLNIQKAMINSNVFVGGTITTNKGGVIAGGRIFSKDSITTDNLGFKRGAITVLNVGVDWRAARAADIRRRRLEKLQKKAQEDRQALRELVQKSKAQLTARHKELKDQLQDRLGRMRPLLEKLEAAVQKADAGVTYSSSARIYVREILAANVNITICGQPVAVTNDVANVGVLPKRKRGSFIVPLEELEKEEGGAKQAS